ncbi:MAG: hypothetical protein GY772_07755 [bacterium]|nr:hypothetical protein [bacterium]
MVRHPAPTPPSAAATAVEAPVVAESTLASPVQEHGDELACDLDDPESSGSEGEHLAAALSAEATLAAQAALAAR